jgi:hypothetical protein
MTDLDAVRDRLLHAGYLVPTAYPGAEALTELIRRSLDDAEALAAALKPEYIAALKAELARLEGTPDAPEPARPAAPERISEPEATDSGVTCACGRVFDKIARWRGHQYYCPARVKTVEPSYHCECGKTFATQGSLNLHRRHCTPEPIVREVAPGFTVNSEGHYQCNCNRNFTQDMHDPAGRCIRCTKENP